MKSIKLYSIILLGSLFMACDSGSTSYPENSVDNPAQPNTTLYQYDYFTDSRDGQVYKTIVIGRQTWFAQNLNYVSIYSRCYEDKEENCALYGRLYLYDEAIKVCPNGWHLPDYAE